MRRRRLLPLLVLALAIAATLGHVCVLPGHVHATPAEHGHDDAASADHHDDGGDAVHAASCDALRPAAASALAPPPLGIAALPERVDAERGAVARVVDTPPPTGSPPPLYLTHHAFLI